MSDGLPAVFGAVLAGLLGGSFLEKLASRRFEWIDRRDRRRREIRHVRERLGTASALFVTKSTFVLRRGPRNVADRRAAGRPVTPATGPGPAPLMYRTARLYLELNLARRALLRLDLDQRPSFGIHALHWLDGAWREKRRIDPWIDLFRRGDYHLSSVDVEDMMTRLDEVMGNPSDKGFRVVGLYSFEQALADPSHPLHGVTIDLLPPPQDRPRASSPNVVCNRDDWARRMVITCVIAYLFATSQQAEGLPKVPAQLAKIGIKTPWWPRAELGGLLEEVRTHHAARLPKRRRRRVCDAIETLEKELKIPRKRKQASSGHKKTRPS